MIYYHCKACGKDIGEIEVTNYTVNGVPVHLSCDQPVEERDTAEMVPKPNPMQRHSRVEEMAMLDAVARLNLGAQLLGDAVVALRSRPEMTKLKARLHLSDLEEIRDTASRIADEITAQLLDDA